MVALSAKGSGALFFGDAMQRPEAKASQNLAGGLQTPERTVTQAGFGEGPVPILGGVAAIDRAIQALPNPPETIIISPGIRDVLARTPVRIFERGLDAIIDRARTLAPGVRVVLLGPLPEVGAWTTSRRYHLAAARVAAFSAAMPSSSRLTSIVV